VIAVAWQYHVKVLAVEHRSHAKTTTKQLDGTITQERESDGWWVVLDNQTSMFLGYKEPAVSVGDTLRLTLERS